MWDWDDTEKILKLIKTRDVIYARKCIVKEIDRDTCAKFIQANHVQGYTNDKIRIGLFYNDELISVMTFGKPRYNKKYEYELIRYCSTHNVVGGSNKLFSYFVDNYDPSNIVSYCDRCKFSGDVYQKLGFICTNSSIGKHWYNMKTNEHFLDSSLRAKGFDTLLGDKYGKQGNGTSNHDLMINCGFVEIYDCGQSTNIWIK